jgi:WD40 repeat protein
MQPVPILGPEWKRGINGRVSAIHMTPDASFVAAGSGDHDVYLMNYSGKLLWASMTGEEVQYVKVSDDGHAVVSCSKDNTISFFNKHGNEAWSGRIPRRVNSVDMSPDGSLVVTGSEDGLVRAFNEKGTVLWTRDCSKPVNSVSISGSGSLVMAGANTNKAYMLTRNGDVRWEFQAQSPVVYVFTSMDGETSFALEAMNNELHQISDRGGELSANTYSQHIMDVSITDDGRYVAIGFSSGFVYYTERNGHLLWRQNVSGPVTSIKISGDGSLVFVTTADKAFYVLNKKGDVLLDYRFDGSADCASCSFEGDYAVVGSLDTVHMFSLGKYIEYVVREQVKLARMMKADEDRRYRPDAETNAGVKEAGGNKCRICGTPILASRMLCNYCEMMQRRSGATGRSP